MEVIEIHDQPTSDAGPPRPAREILAGILPIELNQQNEQIKLEQRVPRKSFAMGDQLIDDHRNGLVVVVAGTAGLIVQRVLQLRRLRKNVRAVQPINENRLIDQNAAAPTADPMGEIHIGRRPELRQMFVIGKEQERIAAIAKP